MQSAAMACDAESEREAQKKTPESVRVADLGGEVHRSAKVGPEGFEPPTKGS